MSVDYLNDNRGTSGNTEQSNLNQSKKDNIYHAIYVAPDCEGSEEAESLHIYTEKEKALKVIRKFPTGRLKSFKSRLDAEQYAKRGSEEINDINVKPSSTTISSEEKSSFKAPKSQELVVFRKVIESGDLESVKKIIWENPRYLISSGDTPAILQEGCRYNALHIVSSKGSRNTEMCKLILDTVSDTRFMALHNGKDDSKSYVNRAQILLDLYLNTPDKGLNETPLHFAAKYGLKDVVKLLVSYPLCDKTLKNKYDQTPLEIICTRKCQDDEFLKREIRMLLEDQYYVPVLRSEDNTIQPEIGQPFSPTSPPRFKDDPLSPRVEVRAFAGPMTKPQAMEFRKKWKTPPRMLHTPTKRDMSTSNLCNFSPCPRSRDADVVRLKDTEKGLESVGRNLAEECRVQWKEFWPFLNGFADLRDHDGLKMLEKYLMERVTTVKKDFKLIGYSPKFSNSLKKINNNRKELAHTIKRNFMYNCANDVNEIQDKQQIDGENHRNKSLDEIELLIEKMGTCSLNISYDSDSDSSEKFFTPPDTPDLLSNDSDNESSEEEMFVAEEGDAIFIEGNVPGKMDSAVLNAIPEIINADIYPFIYQWKHEMTLVTSKDNALCFRMPRRRLQMTPEK